MPKITGDDLLQLARDTKKGRLQGIGLLESHCKLGTIRPGELPTHATQSLNLEVRVNQEREHALALVALKLVATYADAGDGDPALTVTATFGVQYKIEKRLTKAGMERTLRSTAQMVVWPYWREFLQSMTVRMGLPAFPVPLLNIVTSLEEGQGNPDEQKGK